MWDRSPRGAMASTGACCRVDRADGACVGAAERTFGPRIARVAQLAQSTTALAEADRRNAFDAFCHNIYKSQHSM
jgi:hypothetical protein